MNGADSRAVLFAIAFSRQSTHDALIRHMLRKLRTISQWLEWVCLGLIPVVAGIQRVDAASVDPGLWREFVLAFEGYWVLALFSLAAAAIAGKATQAAVSDGFPTTRALRPFWTQRTVHISKAFQRTKNFSTV